MTNKTYTVVGVSTQNDRTKVRFANSMKGRKFMLEYNGHTDVTLVELPEAMAKFDAVLAMQPMEEFKGEVAQAAITAWLEKRTPKARAGAEIKFEGEGAQGEDVTEQVAAEAAAEDAQEDAVNEQLDAARAALTEQVDTLAAAAVVQQESTVTVELEVKPEGEVKATKVRGANGRFQKRTA
jgi:hypothetical protein